MAQKKDDQSPETVIRMTTRLGPSAHSVKVFRSSQVHSPSTFEVFPVLKWANMSLFLEANEKPTTTQKETGRTHSMSIYLSIYLSFFLSFFFLSFFLSFYT